MIERIREGRRSGCTLDDKDPHASATSTLLSSCLLLNY